MQTWKLAAEALFSGFLLSNTPIFANESNWIRTGCLPDSAADSSVRPGIISNSAIAVAIDAAGKKEGASLSIWDEFLDQVWNCPGQLRARVAQLDGFVDRYLIDEESAHFLFDVSYTYWLSEECAKGDLNEVWLADEEMLVDRGSELLTVLMYLQEVNASGLEADLNDFVDAFLTDEDFDLQDDLAVFEVLIQQSSSMAFPYPRLIRESLNVSVGTPLDGLLPGLMCFFKDPADPMHGMGYVFSARLVDKHILPVYMCLMAALKSEWCFPQHLRPNSVQSLFFGLIQHS
ncbi:MAG: hypothetical protein FJ344_00310 [Sphingomonadales bacterium]|nr:hypothetical protein [Sphingomonadales bacterium]